MKRYKPKFEEEWLERDMRPPSSVSEAVSRSMKGNVAKGTKPEVMFRQALREAGLSGYRLNWKKAPGRPDISYPGRKIAIFINGCYWHRCPFCKPSTPKRNVDYWTWKFERNKERDKRKKRDLKRAGWKVFVFWECQIKKNEKKLALQIKNFMSMNVKI